MKEIKQKIFFIVLIILIVAGLISFFVWQNNKKGNPSNPQPSNGEFDGIILFYGDGCTHCAALEEWMTENNIESKVEMKKLEVFNNQENQELLVKKAEACNLAADTIGVPFLWTGTDCVVGDQPIEDYFNQKINLNTNITNNETTK